MAEGAAGMLGFLRGSAALVSSPIRSVSLDRGDPQAPSLAHLLHEHDGTPLHIRLSSLT